MMVGIDRSSNSPSCRNVSSIAVLDSLGRKSGLKLKNLTSGKHQCQRQSTELPGVAWVCFVLGRMSAGFVSRCLPRCCLDLFPGRVNIFTSPPIRFRIEWASGQGMSPLLDLWPILIARQFFSRTRPEENLGINRHEVAR